MLRSWALLFAALPLCGGTLGSADSQLYALPAFDAPPPDYAVPGALSWLGVLESGQWELSPFIFEIPNAGLFLSAAPPSRDSGESAVSENHDAEANPKNSVGIGMAVLLLAYLLRKHFLENADCREFESLHEHLLLVCRDLALVHRSHHQRQIEILRASLAAQRRRSQMRTREYHDLYEHWVIVSRNYSWRTARQIEVLEAALAANRQTRQLQAREWEDLRANLLLADRDFSYKAEGNYETGVEMTLALLVSAVARHCQTHQCRSIISQEKECLAEHALLPA